MELNYFKALELMRKRVQVSTDVSLQLVKGTDDNIYWYYNEIIQYKTLNPKESKGKSRRT